VQQTKDSVTALFSSYTKTADLASAAAVQDARKAGTDAQAAASAAQSTADTAKADAATAQSAASRAQSTASTAKSTADSAKSTADGLATMIRQDADGITVGKSADGETYSTGRTRMTADGLDVLDKAGAVLSHFGASLVRLGSASSSIIMSDILHVSSFRRSLDTAGGTLKPKSSVARLRVPTNTATGTDGGGSVIELVFADGDDLYVGPTADGTLGGLAMYQGVLSSDGSPYTYAVLSDDLEVTGHISAGKPCLVSLGTGTATLDGCTIGVAAWSLLGAVHVRAWRQDGYLTASGSGYDEAASTLTLPSDYRPSRTLSLSGASDMAVGKQQRVVVGADGTVSVGVSHAGSMNGFGIEDFEVAFAADAAMA
jgi:hypothetical protein